MNITSPNRIDATLEDKYTIVDGPAFMTGTQALVLMVKRSMIAEANSASATARPATTRQATFPVTRVRRWPPSTGRSGVPDASSKRTTSSSGPG